ncbi:VTT domain-containing protein [Panacagrimonas sp.]|uniref:VTT domain-containing protein n=1 Tax=Panacagrimonas sp. TaxID=2480088 RepID=UPI003B523D1A
MLEAAQSLLEWFGAHPYSALALLFFASLLDALFLIGAFVPAGMVLFAVGALVALGTLELWPAVLVSALGALSGDGISFALGRRYGERLFETPWLARRQEMIASGRRFFVRHGGKGVILARFLGPLRAVTPAIAGASGMSVIVFVAADTFAALLWALVFLVPGMLFGASLGLAAEVAARLAGLLVLGVLTLIAGIWAARAAIVLFSARAERWLRGLLDWSRRHRRLGRFGPGLADPDQPETPALVAVGALLLLVGLLWLLAFAGLGWRGYPGAFDALTHQTLSDLATPWGTALAHFVARLGTWPVYASTAAAVLAVLLWRRRVRAAAHWVAALSFGAAITALLSLAPLVPTPDRFFGYGDPPPLRDLILPTVIYGYAAMLYATQRPPQVRLRAYATAIVLVLLIALARLLLGREWFSLNAYALVMGLLWIGALTLGYRQHRPERLFAGSFALPVIAAFLVAGAISWGVDRAISTQAATRTSETVALDMPAPEWWDGGWNSLPAARIDMRGRRLRPFDLQWAADLDRVEAELRAAGWQPLPGLKAMDVLRWLTQSTTVDQLPVLPQVHAGNHARLTLRQPLDDSRQRLIRLWDSGVRVSGPDGSEPVWLGTLSEQRARTHYRLFRYPVAEPYGPMLPPLTAPTRLTAIRVAERDGHRLWLMGAPRVLYTAPLIDAPRGTPQPLP